MNSKKYSTAKWRFHLVCGSLAFGLFGLATGVYGQTAFVEIQVEQSSDDTEWSTLTLTDDMLRPDGRIHLQGQESSGIFRLEIDTTTVPPPPAPEGFAKIPAGPFSMGDSFGEGRANEQPVHTVYLSEFYIARTEVTKAQWDTVRSWGLNNGYTDLSEGAGKGPDHPVQMIDWFNAVKWLNAWSEMDGRTPVYRVDGSVYRTGEFQALADFSADGYRLPTEAEWEKAARGGLEGHRYSWWSIYLTAEDGNVAGTVDPAVEVPRTLPVGSFPPNGYGLYDTTGNVWEWVHDWYDVDYYSKSPEADPHGPDVPSIEDRRLFRGAAWNTNLEQSRVAYRYLSPSNSLFNSVGFRAACSVEP